MSDRRGCECQRSHLDHRLRRSIEMMSCSSAQQCAPSSLDVELKAIVVQFLQSLALSLATRISNRLCHSCDSPEISDVQSRIAESKEVPRICAPTPLAPATSDCEEIFGLSGLPAHVAMILCESADILAIRTKLKGGRATRNREPSSYTSMSLSMKEGQRLDWKRNTISRELCVAEERHKLQGRSARSNCRRTRSRHTIIHSHMIIEYNCRARCSIHHVIMQLRKVTSGLPRKKSPSQSLHGATWSRRRGQCAK